MEHKPYKLCEMIESVLMQETMRTFREVETTISIQKHPVTADSIRGTYEEMFSNWRNKIYAASDGDNRHLAFMSMVSLNAMISGLSDEVEIASYDVFDGYDPQNLRKMAQAVDALIMNYAKEYQKVDLQVERYQDIDAFIAQYLEGVR